MVASCQFHIFATLHQQKYPHFTDYPEYWTSFRAYLDVTDDRKTSYTYRESNANTSVVRPVV
jgi:hypothetical protein